MLSWPEPTKERIEPTTLGITAIEIQLDPVNSTMGVTQGRINHWANRANAWGLALERQNTSLLVFHVFRLFTTCQNCRAFWLLCLAYKLRKLTTLAIIVCEWLKRIEPNRTTLYDPRIRSKSVHSWASAEIFPEGQSRNVAYPLQIADDAKQMDVHQTVYPFYHISLCWLNLKSQSFVRNVFYASAIRNAFLFINCVISNFWALSTNNHNLRIINGQNNVSGEKTRKLDSLKKTVSSNEKN